MVRHNSQKHPSDGEAAIGLALRRLKVRYEREKKLVGLKGDSYDYRLVDFYLPNYNAYIEFFGMWDTPNPQKREEERQRYSEKKRIYDVNNVQCIYIYPNQLHYVSKVIKDNLPSSPSPHSPSSPGSGTLPIPPPTSFPVIFGIIILLIIILLSIYLFKNMKLSSQENGSPAVIDEAPERMWNDLKIGDTARDFHIKVLNNNFEQAQNPWENVDLEHFEIRRHYSEPFQIHVYFNGSAYMQDGSSWLPTGALIIRKEMHSGGKVVRSEP